MNAPINLKNLLPATGVQQGTDIVHESAHLHVTGAATYIDDIPEVAGTLYAAIIKSPVAHGELIGDGIDRDGTGEPVRSALALHPEERPECECHQRKPDENDPPDAKAGKNRAIHGARRARHDIVLVRLEADHQAERHGGDHVDPQDLDRGDRQDRAGQHRRQDDRADEGMHDQCIEAGERALARRHGFCGHAR